MKFSLAVVTAGLLVATAMASPSFDLNVFGKNSGVLAETNLAPTIEQCTHIGTLQTFTITNCTSEPCEVEKGKTAIITWAVQLGANEVSNNFKQHVSVGIFAFDVSPVMQATGTQGQSVSLAFPFGIPPDAPSGPFDVQLELVGSNTEGCVQTTVVVVPPK